MASSAMGATEASEAQEALVVYVGCCQAHLGPVGTIRPTTRRLAQPRRLTQPRRPPLPRRLTLPRGPSQPRSPRLGCLSSLRGLPSTVALAA